jgi:hypothetical protein
LPDDIPVAGPLQFDVVIETDENGKIVKKPKLPEGLRPIG